MRWQENDRVGDSLNMQVYKDSGKSRKDEIMREWATHVLLRVSVPH